MVPQNTKVFKVRDHVLDLEDDLSEEHGSEYNENEDGVTMNIGKNTIVANSTNQDSMIVNGKKVSKVVGEKMMDSMDIDFKDFKDFKDVKDVNITIKNGKKEISIKTK